MTAPVYLHALDIQDQYDRLSARLAYARRCRVNAEQAANRGDVRPRFKRHTPVHASMPTHYKRVQRRLAVA